MPPADRVVVWRSGDVLLAAPLDRTAEVAPVNAQGQAVTRSGALELVPFPSAAGKSGTGEPRPMRRAVVLRTSDQDLLALGADAVFGVRAAAPAGPERVPAWLGRLDTSRIAAVITLEDGALAALVALDALDPA